MLKKLLKYDLSAIFKLWWIMAVSSLGLSVIGGLCLKTLTSMEANEISPIIVIMAALGIVATVIGLSAFLVVTMILIYVRFYKNFFTDEGYLTFTLPVKRSQLLNSKLISTFVATIATYVVLIFDVILLLAIGIPDFFDSDVWKMLGHFFGVTVKEMGIYFFIYAIEILLLALLTSLSSMLLVYICITLASVIVKKARVITAIGIYYGATTVVTFSAELVYLFGIMFLGNTITNLSASATMGAIALILLVLTVFIAAIASALYLLEYYLLDKKLNLA
ncbi:MAG: hypothetical protein IJ345_05890 [Clostridia bacterium]|nr:hypothetical protein [Clostridia bacterium]